MTEPQAAIAEIALIVFVGLTVYAAALLVGLFA